MISYSVNGKTYHEQNGRNLLESLREKLGEGSKEALGFCYQPLLKSSQKCLLCTVYDEKSDQLIRACEYEVREGSSYSLVNDQVKEAMSEIRDVYIKTHSFHCSNCENNGLCDLKNALGTGHPKSASEVLVNNPQTFELNESLSLNMKECIHCGLCCDFEKEFSKESTLTLGDRGQLKVCGDVTHNMGINLLDICPTGCFSDKEVSKSPPNVREADFCRECDRLCRIDVILASKGREYRPLRAAPPRHMAHWICDEANTPFKRQTGVRLHSHLIKREAQQWVPIGSDQELPSLSQEWLLLLPSNLPDDLWEYVLDQLAAHKEYGKKSVCFIDWPDRSQENGLLREPRNFMQEQRQRVQEVCEVVSLDSLAEYQKKVHGVVLIAPETIKSSHLWQEVINLIQGFSQRVFVGPYLLADLYEKVDMILSVPAYSQMSWSGKTYQGERVQVNRPKLSMNFLKEKGK